MDAFFEALEGTLKRDARFLAGDDALLRNRVFEAAMQMDGGLIRLLLSDQATRARFFVEAGGALVFDKVGFGWAVNNRCFLPDSYTRFKNRIGLVDGRGGFVSASGDVVLAFPHKDCVLEGGQTREDQRRDEVFYHEVLAQGEIDRLLHPKALAGATRHTAAGAEQTASFSEGDNLVIKGNNLLAIASLLKRYEGKIKCIYIDPPYNTQGDANTFCYNNTFNHSSWLTFMKNRLEISKRLLRADGVLAIAIDDWQQAYLTVLCDELFGRENKIGVLVVQIKPSERTTDTYLSTSHEYILLYSKQPNLPTINFFELDAKQKSQYKFVNEDGVTYKWRDFLRTGGYSTPEERHNSCYPIYFNPSNNDTSISKHEDYIEILPIDSKGEMRVWRKTIPSFLRHLEKGEIKIESIRGKWKIRIMDKVKHGVRPKSVWVDAKYDAAVHGTRLLETVLGKSKQFSFPKSLYAVMDVLRMFTDDDDIILDFFAGSGTTGHAVMEINKDGGDRRFILCEQMDYVEQVTVRRLQKVIEAGGGSFVYCELARCNQAFVDGAMAAKTDAELADLLRRVLDTGFVSCRVDPARIREGADGFDELAIADKRRFVLELLDKNMLYVNLCDMDDADYRLGGADRAFTRSFYGLGGE